MTLRDWLMDTEGYSFRMERLYDDIDEMLLDDSIIDVSSDEGQKYHRRMLAWLQSAYDVGFEQGKSGNDRI